jgi:hypothetical protein
VASEWFRVRYLAQWHAKLARRYEESGQPEARALAARHRQAEAEAHRRAEVYRWQARELNGFQMPPGGR